MRVIHNNKLIAYFTNQIKESGRIYVLFRTARARLIAILQKKSPDTKEEDFLASVQLVIDAIKLSSDPFEKDLVQAFFLHCATFFGKHGSSEHIPFLQNFLLKIKEYILPGSLEIYPEENTPQNKVVSFWPIHYMVVSFFNNCFEGAAEQDVPVLEAHLKKCLEILRDANVDFRVSAFSKEKDKVGFISYAIGLKNDKCAEYLIQNHAELINCGLQDNGEKSPIISAFVRQKYVLITKMFAKGATFPQVLLQPKYKQVCKTIMEMNDIYFPENEDINLDELKRVIVLGYSLNDIRHLFSLVVSNKTGNNTPVQSISSNLIQPHSAAQKASYRKNITDHFKLTGKCNNKVLNDMVELLQAGFVASDLECMKSWLPVNQADKYYSDVFMDLYAQVIQDSSEKFSAITHRFIPVRKIATFQKICIEQYSNLKGDRGKSFNAGLVGPINNLFVSIKSEVDSFVVSHKIRFSILSPVVVHQQHCDWLFHQYLLMRNILNQCSYLLKQQLQAFNDLNAKNLYLNGSKLEFFADFLKKYKEVFIPAVIAYLHALELSGFAPEKNKQLVANAKKEMSQHDVESLSIMIDKLNKKMKTYQPPVEDVPVAKKREKSQIQWYAEAKERIQDRNFERAFICLSNVTDAEIINTHEYQLYLADCYFDTKKYDEELNIYKKLSQVEALPAHKKKELYQRLKRNFAYSREDVKMAGKTTLFLDGECQILIKLPDELIYIFAFLFALKARLACLVGKSATDVILKLPIKNNHDFDFICAELDVGALAKYGFKKSEKFKYGDLYKFFGKVPGLNQEIKIDLLCKPKAPEMSIEQWLISDSVSRDATANATYLLQCPTDPAYAEVHDFYNGLFDALNQIFREIPSDQFSLINHPSIILRAFYYKAVKGYEWSNSILKAIEAFMGTRPEFFEELDTIFRDHLRKMFSYAHLDGEEKQRRDNQRFVYSGLMTKYSMYNKLFRLPSEEDQNTKASAAVSMPPRNK